VAEHDADGRPEDTAGPGEQAAAGAGERASEEPARRERSGKTVGAALDRLRRAAAAHDEDLPLGLTGYDGPDSGGAAPASS